MFNRNIFFAVVCFILAYAYMKYSSRSTKSKIDNIAEFWITSTRNRTAAFSRILVGFNACTDLIVRGTDVLKALNVKPGLARDRSKLHNIAELQEAFAHFFSRGSAAERPFADGKVFNEIIEEARSLKHANWYVGGNAALIAQKMSSISADAQVKLVGPIGPKLKELLHPAIQHNEASLSSEDQVHLIMEYEAGESWGGYLAPVATRFITSHDLPNSEAEYLEELFDTVPHYQPDLIIFSGLHMLEGTVEPFWRHRLDVLAERLTYVPTSVPVHLELASMSSANLLEAIVDNILQHVSAVGLNEQELVFLNRVKAGPNHAAMTSHRGQPIIHHVTEVLAWILNNYRHSSRHPDSRLSRIHFHSLTYHVIATLPSHWSDTHIGVAAGTQMAGLQACDIQELGPDFVELEVPNRFKLYPGAQEISLDSQEPVIEFEYKGLHFVFSPVLVCKKPRRTVGLGDAISASGLLYSKFNLK